MIVIVIVVVAAVAVLVVVVVNVVVAAVTAAVVAAVAVSAEDPLPQAWSPVTLITPFHEGQIIARASWCC